MAMIGSGPDPAPVEGFRLHRLLIAALAIIATVGVFEMSRSLEPPLPQTATAFRSFEAANLQPERPLVPHFDRPGYLAASKYVVFSLYGGRPMDLAGAIFNARTIPYFYWSWKTLFVVDTTVPESFLAEIRAAGGEVWVLPPEYSNWGELRRIFRVLVLDNPAIEYVMFRDTDSRVSAREISSVNTWLRSDKSYHLMRDHWGHRDWILAGLWGVYAPTIRQQIGNITESITKFVGDRLGHTDKMDDQRWLKEVVFPNIQADCIDHDAFYCGQFSAHSKPFPLPRDYHGDYPGHILDTARTEIVPGDYITSLWPEYRLNSEARLHQQVPEQCRLQPEFIYG